MKQLWCYFHNNKACIVTIITTIYHCIAGLTMNKLTETGEVYCLYFALFVVHFIKNLAFWSCSIVHMLAQLSI